MAFTAFEYLESEGCGFIRETVEFAQPVKNEQMTKQISEMLVGEAGDKGGRPRKNVVVRIAAIHDCVTKNATEYHADELRASIPSWTGPYPKPAITDHNAWEVSRVVGRIIKAEMGKHNGKECLIFTVPITDKEAAEKVIDGRYQTVSIGARVKSACCSVCGKDWAKGNFCDHNPGQYELKDPEDKESLTLCTLIMGGISGHEVSFVTVPADENAMIISIDTGGRKSSDKEESDLGLMLVSNESIDYVSTEGEAVRIASSIEEKGRNMIASMMSIIESASTFIPTEEDRVTDQASGTDNEDVQDADDKIVETPEADTAEEPNDSDVENTETEEGDKPTDDGTGDPDPETDASVTDNEEDDKDAEEEATTEESEADSEDADESASEDDAEDADAQADAEDEVVDEPAPASEDTEEKPAEESEKVSGPTDELRNTLVTLYIERGIRKGTFGEESVNVEELLNMDLDEIRALVKEQSDDGQSLAEKLKDIQDIARTESRMIGSDADKSANANVRTETTMRVIGREGRTVERSYEVVTEEDSEPVNVRVISKPKR
jgi:hypothetical protein